MAIAEETAKASGTGQPESPWAAVISKLREWDPAWAELALKITTNHSTSGVLSAKFSELVLIGLNASRTNLNPEGTRRHIRAAIAAGATRQEILFVLECASGMSIHSGSFNAPLLLQEANVGSL